MDEQQSKPTDTTGQTSGGTPTRVGPGGGPPRSEHRPLSESGFDFNRPTIVSLLYLASFLVGITGIVGIILAHVWKGEAHDSWMTSHYTYLIRTFWFGLLGFVVATVLSIVLIGFLLMPVIAVWIVVRSVMSLLRAQKREPMPDPQTLLF